MLFQNIESKGSSSWPPRAGPGVVCYWCCPSALVYPAVKSYASRHWGNSTGEGGVTGAPSPPSSNSWPISWPHNAPLWRWNDRCNWYKPLPFKLWFFLKCVVDMHIGKSIKKMTKMRHSEERVGEVRRGGLESGKKKNTKKSTIWLFIFYFHLWNFDFKCNFMYINKTV